VAEPAGRPAVFEGRIAGWGEVIAPRSTSFSRGGHGGAGHGDKSPQREGFSGVL
jgi:hypothetical protein